MKTPLAWHKFTHQPLRTAAALSGVCFALLLIFMQLGFYDACFRSATMVFDQMDFDIALVSPQYVLLAFPGSIPRQRLSQAKAVRGVAGAVPLHVAVGDWYKPETGFHGEILVLGVDPREQTFQDAALVEKVQHLKKNDAAIMDQKSRQRFQPVETGMIAELNNRRLEIAAVYAHGTGFISDALIIVNDRTFCRLFQGWPVNEVSLGLVKLEPGADAAVVIRDLQAVLPADVLVWNRSELEAFEQHHFVSIKPTGIMFSSGVLLAFAVGVAILYQILASEITHHLKDYATLQAIGYGKGFVYKLVLQQGTLYALLGFVPAVLLAWGIYALTRWSTNLPIVMTGPRIALVLLLAVAMCCLSGLLVSRRGGRADPADLF